MGLTCVESIRKLIRAWRNNFPVDDDDDDLRDIKSFGCEPATAAAISLVHRRIGEVLACVELAEITDAENVYSCVKSVVNGIEQHIRELGFDVALPSAILEMLSKSATLLELHAQEVVL